MAEIEIIPESIKLIKMTDTQYFSSEFGDYVSNSRLGLVNPEEGGSIENYIEGFKGSTSTSFELGSAVHGIVLQPDEYCIAPINKPSGKLGVFADNVYALEKSIEGITRTEAIEASSLAADYYVGKLSAKRLETAMEACEPYWKDKRDYESTLTPELIDQQVYLSKAMHEKYTKCVEGIESNPLIQSTLYPKGLLSNPDVYNEYAILAEVIVTLDNGEKKKVKLKAKLDNFTVDHECQIMTLNDLKTTGKPVPFFMGGMAKRESGEREWYDGSFQKYHYARQMGMYSWLMSCYLQQEGFKYKLKVNMLVVETIPPFRTKICSVNGKHIKQGLEEFKKLLIIVANG